MQELQGRNRGPVTEERLVRAVEVLAEIVKHHGSAFGPLHNTVEQELAAFREQRQSLKAAAERPARKRVRKVA